LHVLHLDTGGLATLIVSQIGFGGTLGFLLGYGLKKVAAILLKAVALVSALFLLVMVWLSSVGIITFDINAFTATADNTLAGSVVGLVSFLTFLVQVLPMGGSFGLGFYLGAKKG